jgi:hypothetical protein
MCIILGLKADTIQRSHPLRYSQHSQYFLAEASHPDVEFG